MRVVDDLAAAVTWLEARGVRFTPGGIRKGAAGHDVAHFATADARNAPSPLAIRPTSQLLRLSSRGMHTSMLYGAAGPEPVRRAGGPVPMVGATIQTPRWPLSPPTVLAR